MDNISTALTDLWRTLLLFVPKAVAFVLILLIGYFVAKAIGKAVDAILERVVAEVGAPLPGDDEGLHRHADLARQPGDRKTRCRRPGGGSTVIGSGANRSPSA